MGCELWTRSDYIERFNAQNIEVKIIQYPNYCPSKIGVVFILYDTFRYIPILRTGQVHNKTHKLMLLVGLIWRLVVSSLAFVKLK